MMNVTIDIGNSSVKINLFTDPDSSQKWYQGSPKELDLTCLFEENREITGGILVHTGAVPEGWIPLLQKKLERFIILGPDIPLPVENRYQSKKTLGYDRIAAVTGAHWLFPDKNVLVIDAGTALTSDLITADGVYLGGTISPGLTMRFKALARFTANLPELIPVDKVPELGRDTESAILSGVIQGILAETEQCIHRMHEKYKPLVTIITGGDAIFFDKNLKNSIFVRPDLVAIGLNRILAFNEGI